jgi:hypothetical protein
VVVVDGSQAEYAPSGATAVYIRSHLFVPDGYVHVNNWLSGNEFELERGWSVATVGENATIKSEATESIKFDTYEYNNTHFLTAIVNETEFYLFQFQNNTEGTSPKEMDTMHFLRTDGTFTSTCSSPPPFPPQLPPPPPPRFPPSPPLPPSPPITPPSPTFF